ncbi:MAG: DUF3990 domain-containing protein [Agriterribacter sp.]
MKLYHGSYTKIEVIDLTKAKPYKDFGVGFYATKFPNQAKIWAERLADETDKTGFITEFEFNEYAYRDESIKVLKFEAYNSEWFDFVIQNRQNDTNSHDYDIVEGPVADDKIQRRIDIFLSNNISKEQFLEELKWHEETHQICFCTVASLQFIKRFEAEKHIYGFSHISEPIVEKLVLDYEFDEQTASDKLFTSKTFTQIADTSTEFHLKTWIEIYELLLAELNLKPNEK